MAFLLIVWKRSCSSGGKPDSQGAKEDLNGKLLDMYSSIYTMRQDLERIKKPQGSKENPVRSCKDLYFGHPQFKDGTVLPIALQRSRSVLVEMDCPYEGNP